MYTWDTVMLSLDAFGWFLSTLEYCHALTLCFWMVPMYTWDTVMLSLNALRWFLSTLGILSCFNLMLLNGSSVRLGYCLALT